MYLSTPYPWWQHSPQQRVLSNPLGFPNCRMPADSSLIQPGLPSPCLSHWSQQLVPLQVNKRSFRATRTMATYHLDRLRTAVDPDAKEPLGRLETVEPSGTGREGTKKVIVSRGTRVRDARRYTTWSFWAIESAEREFRLHISPVRHRLSSPQSTLGIPPFSPHPPPVSSSSRTPPKLVHSKTHSKRVRFVRHGPEGWPRARDRVSLTRCGLKCSRALGESSRF